MQNDKKAFLQLILALSFSSAIFSQDSLSGAKDTTIIYQNQAFTLPDVIIRNNFNVAAFINYVKNDTTFYKAFRNLRVLNYSSFNDIIINDKKGNEHASLHSITTQTYANGCRRMQTKEEHTTGDFYDKKGNYNYTTAEMYAGLFFTKGKVCGETNIVKGKAFSVNNKSGLEKHKEQLKQLFFNPGTKIPGLPFIGNKVALFDKEVSKLYNYRIDEKDYLGQQCYIFTIKPKEDLSRGEKNDIVINEMTTWFNAQTLDIMARNYSLRYKAGIFDFDVNMEVQLEKAGELLVPKVLRYNGYWDVIFKKAERAVFTATLFIAPQAKGS
jgi:hypothetical protein